MAPRFNKSNSFFFVLLLSVIVHSVHVEANAQVRRGGMVVDKGKYSRVPLARPLMRGAETTEIPRRYSLKQFAPIPGNQGEYTTSPAWATTYSALTCMTAALAGVTSRSAIDSLSFSPAFTYLSVLPESHGECQTPISIEDAFDVIRQRGSLRLQEFNYECTGRISEDDSMKALDRKIAGYRKLFEDGSGEKSEPVRRSIASGKPVVVGLYVTGSIDDAKEVWMPTQEEYGMLDMAQAMAVVAYDDSKYGGSFELMNSWGTEWGNEGFLWITYADFNHFCASAFEILSETPNDTESTTASVEHSVSKTITASLRLIQDSNEPIKVVNMSGFFRTERALPSGTRLRVDMTVERECFVYAFATDSTSLVPHQLFPRGSANTNGRIEPNANLSIPGPTRLNYSKLDTVKGLDYYCLVISSSQIDGEKFLENFRAADGGFHGRLQSTLDQFNLHSLNTNSDNMVDLVVVGDGPIIPIIVEVQHK